MKTNTKVTRKVEPGHGATYGLYPKEQRVVDLYEAGVPNHLIEELTGMSAERVRHLIAQYGDVGPTCDGWIRKISKGTDALVARIFEVHGAGAVMG